MGEEANKIDNDLNENKKRRDRIIDGFKDIQKTLKIKLDDISTLDADIDELKNNLEYLDDTFKTLFEVLNELEVITDSTYFQSNLLIGDYKNEINLIKNSKDFYNTNSRLLINLAAYLSNTMKDLKIEDDNKKRKEMEGVINELKKSKEDLENKINKVDIIADDLKNKKVHEIFEDDSEKFKKLARRYEIAFYIALAFLFLYFFGWYIEIDTAIFKFKFAEQFYGNHTPTFYVQKISILILSSTLAAFLLKRSFMNRRLADDAYRTAKELDALPRYMEGMPDEMKEKIRFDLTYKYFGNGIHHESYTGGENLMHENIKANTDFIKAVKDLPPKVEVPNADKAPKDAA